LLRDDKKLRVLRRTFGPRGMKYKKAPELCVTRSFIISVLHEISFDNFHTSVQHPNPHVTEATINTIHATLFINKEYSIYEVYISTRR
jgi:hypothetical protein